MTLYDFVAESEFYWVDRFRRRCRADKGKRLVFFDSSGALELYNTNFKIKKCAGKLTTNTLKSIPYETIAYTNIKRPRGRSHPGPRRF